MWFGQTFDMKLEHDDCEPRSLQCSTNKIIFSQISPRLFYLVLQGDQSATILFGGRCDMRGS